MELMEKQGYKQTEVGLIPEDWNVLTINDVATVIGGGTPSTFVSEYWNGNINWFTPTEIGKNKYSYQSKRKITSLGLSNSSAQILPIGTILMSTRASIGDLSILLTEATTNQGFQSLIAKNDFYNEFLYYLVQNNKSKLIKNSSGSTFLEISPNKVKSIEIPIPPTLEEQKAIATALSDVDELISNLDKLITKKKAIKQGAMQQLLTPPHKGGKRLEGYTSEWEEKKLGEYTDLITKGTTPTSLGKAFTTQGVNFIKAESIDKTGKIINDKVAYIDSETHEILSRSKIKANDLLFTIAGVLGRVGVILEDNLPANTNQAVAIIRLKKLSDLSIEFFFHILRTNAIIKHIEAISVQGAQANFSLTDVANIPLNIPSELLEQKAIAEILSDMDLDIEQLESKKAKYQNVKQGMMQELLTGKTRLV